MPVIKGNQGFSGSAFPYCHDLDSEIRWCKGMTLRDYFAAQALAGLCAKHGVVLSWGLRNTGDHDVETAAAAYRYADAMLAARESK